MSREPAKLVCHLFLLSLSFLVPGGSEAFGTKRSHEDLALVAVDRADADAGVRSYLREGLGLARGFDEPLALQFGLDARIDRDLITDSSNPLRIITRLNRSLSRRDEDDNGTAAFPFIPNDYLRFFRESCRGRVDFDACYAAELPRAEVGLLIAVGTYAEDNPNPRARHHFHDPERVHGASDNYGLDDSGRIPTRIDSMIADFAAAGFRGGSWLRAVASYFGISSLANFELRGRSAIDRALNTTRGGGPASDDSPSNLFALPDAERYLYRAVTDSEEDDRENYMALHFVALGHVLHLLQDMGSVAHARNDFVVDHFLLPEVFGARSLEGAADDEEIYSSVVFAAAQGGLFNKPVQAMVGSGSSTVPTGFYEIVQASLDPEGLDVEDFWDRQPLGEPDDSQPDRAGLAERVHNHFVSAGSVSNSASQGGYDRPLLPLWSLGSQVGSGPDAVRSVELPERDLQTGAVTANTSRYLSSPTVPHLARCNYHCIYGLPDARLNYSVIDESVQRDYLELLFPLVLDYTAKFLRHYLAQRIQVVPMGPSQFTLRNLTDLPFTADSDAIEIAYTAADPCVGLPASFWSCLTEFCLSDLAITQLGIPMLDNSLPPIWDAPTNTLFGAGGPPFPTLNNFAFFTTDIALDEIRFDIRAARGRRHRVRSVRRYSPCDSGTRIVGPPRTWARGPGFRPITPLRLNRRLDRYQPSMGELVRRWSVGRPPPRSETTP